MVVIYVFDVDIEVKKQIDSVVARNPKVWGLIPLADSDFFSLYHAHDKTKNIFLYLKLTISLSLFTNMTLPILRDRLRSPYSLCGLLEGFSKRTGTSFQNGKARG